MNEWQYVFTSLTHIFSLFNVILISRLFYGVQYCKKIWKYISSGALLFVTDYGLVKWFGYGLLYSAVMFGAIVLSALILVKGRRGRASLYIFSAFLLYLQWCTMISFLDILFRLDSIIWYTGESVGPFILFTDFLLFAILLFILFGNKARRMIRFTEKEIVLITILLISCPFLKKDTDDTRYLVRYELCMLIMNLVIFYGAIHRKNAGYYRDLSENYRQQFDEEYTYFKDYKRQQKNIAKFRHDWNNHLILLTAMFEKGEYEKAKRYFETLSGENRAGNSRILTGNEVVDIILNAKWKKLEQEKIVVTYSSGFDNLQFMEPVDCCILFSNLIDNAIEANCKCDAGRYITIDVSQKAQTLMLSVENRMGGELKTEFGHLISTKEDADSHGIGTQNVFEIIKKYHGEYRILAEKNIFAFRIIFPFHNLSEAAE